MNIEEAIKQLKKHKAEIDKEYISARYSKAIETLLTAYEKEKEKNKKINKYIEDRAKIGKDIQTFINKDYVEQEYISKDKIKEKIEEYKKDGKIINQTMPYCGEYKNHFEIKALQSLLEKE